MEANHPTQSQPETAQRNFVIPGCVTIVQSIDESGMPVEQLLSIAFNLAGSNPGARVDFWIKVLPD